MASPTWAEIWTQIRNTVKILNELDKFANANSPNWIALEDTLTQSLEGDYAPQLLASLRSRRASISSVMSPASVRAMLSPLIRELGKVIGAPERNTGALMRRIYDYMIDQAPDETLKTRALTYGSPSAAGGNTGNGTILRLTVDEEGHNLEAQHTEAMIAECVSDQNSTDEHEEVFQLRGVERERDFLQVAGSGVVRLLTAKSARDSARLLGNPSFSQYSGTAASAGSESTPTAITNWTAGTIGNFRMSVDKYHRDFIGDTTPTSVRFTTNDSLTQKIVSERRTRLDVDTPYWLQCAIYRESNCDGNISITMGSVTRTVAMSTLTNSAWNIVTILATANSNCWYKNFKEADLDIKIELASRTTGTIYVDDVLFVPWDFFAGSYVLILPAAAANTTFLLDDKFTWTDSESTRGIIQYWLWRAGLGYLPSAASPTIADPS